MSKAIFSVINRLLELVWPVYKTIFLTFWDFLHSPLHAELLLRNCSPCCGAVPKAILPISNRQTRVAPYHHTLSCLRRQASIEPSDPIAKKPIDFRLPLGLYYSKVAIIVIEQEQRRIMRKLEKTYFPIESAVL